MGSWVSDAESPGRIGRGLFLRLILYSRKRCHLCDEARRIIDEAGLEVEEVDVDLDPALRDEYGLMVPVVVFDGKVLFTGGQSPGSLSVSLSEAGLTSL